MEQENWINEILDSTNGMTSVMPDAQLFSKIQNRIETQKTVNPQWVWLAAASIILLVALNVKFIFFETSNEERATELIVSSISKSNQLYNHG
ncbi:MAG: hypothetical protein IPN80_07790 [Flavobacterium sp.]|nr:hypothetical protein [Flavobacterium sp.]